MPGLIHTFEGPFAFLANDWTCQVEYEGDAYPSALHAYQAAKTTDSHKRTRIRQAQRAHVALDLGHSLRRRPDWSSDLKVSIMREILADKFGFRGTAEMLLRTEDKVIEWRNDKDFFWGKVSQLGAGPITWAGTNWLGRLLMEARANAREFAEAR